MDHDNDKAAPGVAAEGGTVTTEAEASSPIKTPKVHLSREKLAEHDDGNKRLIRYCMTDDEIQLFSLMFNLRNASYAVESLMGLLHDSYVYRQFEGHRGDYKDCPAEICRSFRNMVAEWNKAVR